MTLSRTREDKEKSENGPNERVRGGVRWPCDNNFTTTCKGDFYKKINSVQKNEKYPIIASHLELASTKNSD